ncbi:MAG: homoserine O-succinyltransferase [Alphaproteobacteria bacterium]|nr:homoserine O-succinyltransferase [Alphaproteobacteria bacterium]
MSVKTFGDVSSLFSKTFQSDRPQKDRPKPDRPKIVFINLMDNALGTEKHFLNILKKASPDAEVILCRMACNHKDPRYFNEQDYLNSDRYQDWQTVIGNTYADQVIVSGINRGLLSYDDMKNDYKDFWDECCTLFRKLQHATRNGQVGHATLICWAAFAAMKDLYEVEKDIHAEKFYGLFPHKIPSSDHPLVKGTQGSEILIPQSRYSYMESSHLKDVIDYHQGTVAMDGPDGPAIWTLEQQRISCIINHPEYSIDTLHKEYEFGKSKEGDDFAPPRNYDVQNINCAKHRESFARLEEFCITFYQNLINHALEARPNASLPYKRSDEENSRPDIVLRQDFQRG